MGFFKHPLSLKANLDPTGLANPVSKSIRLYDMPMSLDLGKITLEPTAGIKS